MWTSRAVAETGHATRTWFGTLTFAPAIQQTALARARQRLSRQGIDFETLPEEERFALHWRELQRQCTLFIKRVRKAHSTKLRYLLVVEAHKSNVPHCHMLLHESSEHDPVRKRELEGQWKDTGFSAWRIVENDNPRAVEYVCKYLSKSAVARVRASARYGDVSPDPTGLSHNVVAAHAGGRTECEVTHLTLRSDRKGSSSPDPSVQNGKV